jgi:hypothetical protein
MDHAPDKPVIKHADLIVYQHNYFLLDFCEVGPEPTLDAADSSDDVAVRAMPGSGTGAELLAWAGIDADHVAAAVRQLVRGE